MYGTEPTSLKINEGRIVLCIQHDITRLKVPIHKTADTLTRQVICHLAKTFLKLHLMKFHSSSLQETILEIIQVKHHVCPVHFTLWIALIKIQSLHAIYLYVGQTAYCPFQQFNIHSTIFTAGLAPTFQCLEKRPVSQICLQVSESILTHSQYTWHR